MIADKYASNELAAVFSKRKGPAGSMSLAEDDDDAESIGPICRTISLSYIVVDRHSPVKDLTNQFKQAQDDLFKQEQMEKNASPRVITVNVRPRGNTGITVPLFLFFLVSNSW